MSTAYSSAKQQYIGNGVTTEWGFDFPIKKHSELKVYLKRSGLPQVLLEEGVDYSFVTDNTITFPIKTGEAKLQAADVLALQRESVFESEYNFSNQQRLEPEEVMHADDNLERQIQELKRDVTQAIRIQPTSNINTDEYFIAVESIYENLDNITNVSGISAEIVNCSDNISDISTVSSNIANVNAVVQSISDVNTVANNISDVNTAALNIEAIQDAPNQANAASQSASDASQSATNAANSATASSNSATASANSATASAASAQAAQDTLNDVQGLIATPIGTVFQSIYVDESLDIARQLNGQLISSTKFTGFRSWLNTVQTATPSLFTTETNWQAEKTNSKLGQCGKFVVDDTAGTIRLPCVVNAQGLLELSRIGNLVNESLPNITGKFGSAMTQGNFINFGVGAFGSYEDTSMSQEAPQKQGPFDSNNRWDFDASRSSSAYQNNAPVQQEAVQYPYYIQVATGVEETLPAIREYNINTPFFFGQSMYSDIAPDNASWLASNGQWNAKSVYPDYYDWLVEQMNAGVSGFVASTAAYTDYDFVINTADQTFRLPLLNGSEDLPGSTFTNLTLNDPTGTNNYNFTVTKNCFIVLRSTSMTASDSSGTMIRLETTSHMDYCTSAPTKASTAGVSLFAKKGESVNVGTFGNWGTLDVFRQYDAVGNGSLYYYVGDTVQDASLINAGAVLGQLSDKISRTAASDREMVVGWGMPDYSATISGVGNNYTAPSNGYFWFSIKNNNSARTIIVNGIKYTDVLNSFGTFGGWQVPLSKGDTIIISSANTSLSSSYFIPLKGVN